MNIHFCECGGVLAPFGRGKMKCRSCGKVVEKEFEGKLTTAAKKEEIIVIEDNKNLQPTTKKICPKCNNNTAYWWILQTRSSDEPPTRFFRCTNDKCKHTWREYS